MAWYQNPDGSWAETSDRGPTYVNPFQFPGAQPFEWGPEQQRIEPTGFDYTYDWALLDLADRVRSGRATPKEQQEYAAQRQAALAIPARADPTTMLRTIPQTQGEDQPMDWSRTLSQGSPDWPRIMIELGDKVHAGTASPAEEQFYRDTYRETVDRTIAASTPDDAGLFSLGTPFGAVISLLGLAAGGAGAFGALGGAAAGAAGVGAGAGAAGAGAGAAAAGGGGLLGSLGPTLGTIGGIAGFGGQAAGLLGAITQQDWLSKIGMGLGVAGGLAGGLGGISNAVSGGVSSLGDAAKLAQNVGRVGSAIGTASGQDALKQASSYLGLAGKLGGLASGALPTSLTDWRAAQPAAGGGKMAWDDWLSTSGLPTTMEEYANWPQPSYEPFGADPSAADQYRQIIGSSGGFAPNSLGSGSGPFSSILGALGSVGSFLGKNASWLGPAASTLGSLGAGAIGSNAAGDASQLQANALNRGIDLQTAQWLQQQANQAPWLQAGQTALGHLTGRMAWEGPQQPGATPAISGANYGLPGTTPGWTPQAYQGPGAVQAGDYRWTPGQGPSAANYRYTPGQTPDAAQYASGAPQLYQGAMPGTAIPTLTGQQVLDQDPGVQFRMDEARKALETSALARGTGMSGSTLGALGRQSQDLSSQEYGNAWQRMMGANAEQYGRNWNQYLQNWQQGVTGTQLGLQTNAQNFGQAMSAAQLREQVNQVASQQGWNQAQTEAAFREQMAQQASQQGYAQALAGQGQQFTQGLQSAQWNQGQQQSYEQAMYDRMLDQSKLRYGQDIYANETQYARDQQAYAQQIAELQRQWGNFAQVAGLGQAATNQVGNQGLYANEALSKLYGQLGGAQAGGVTGGANAWMNALSNVNSSVQGGLGTAAYQQGISSLLAGMNR